MGEHTSVSHPLVKIFSAWAAAFGLSTWSDVAAFLAALYSFILLMEWVWKRFGRGLMERFGWVKPLRRRRDD